MSYETEISEWVRALKNDDINYTLCVNRNDNGETIMPEREGHGRGSAIDDYFVNSENSITS